MRLSEKGKVALVVSEGIVTTCYKDSVGVHTIGIGHTKGAGDPNPKDFIGKTLSLVDILKIFDTDIKKYEGYINQYVKVKLTQNEFDALVHFVYNVGPTNFKRSKLLKNLNSNENKKLVFKTGFHGFLKQKELKSRRDKERDIALEGKYGSSYSLVIDKVNSKLQPVYSSGKKVDIAKLLTPKEKTFNPIKDKKSFLEVIFIFLIEIVKKFINKR